MQISHTFDAGSIEVVSLDDPRNIRLRLRKDNAASFAQWFYFRVSEAAGQPLRMVFENAHEAAYPDWEGYRCMASYDRKNWFRIASTRYENGQLIVEHTPERAMIYYAYFEPYSHERHLDLMARAEASPFAFVTRLGSTVQGRDLDMIMVGRPSPQRVPVWVIARQHPGETMAEWLVEGMLDRLLDPADPISRRIREYAVLYLVPNMNPDGSVLGNLRTNAAGVNLNRAWKDPDPITAPEVFLTRKHVLKTGCNVFLDIHGDESLPWVFFSTADTLPGVSPATQKKQAQFIRAFEAASPDFQTKNGYTPGCFGEETLTLASKWAASHFDCVGLTLEMPFKDNQGLPDGQTGWNGARSKRLGAALLQALWVHLADARA